MPFYEVLAFRNERLVDGKWEPFRGFQIPMPPERGGGIGITLYEKLIGVDDDILVNPANGDVLHRTKRSKERGDTKSYFSKETGVLVHAWLRNILEGE